MTSYVAGDVRAIQEYVFGSPRLLEMRGASALVDAFDRGAVPYLVEGSGGELGFAGGGNFLARWEGPDAPRRAEEFEERVRTAFLDLTGSDGLTVVRVESDRAFEEAQADVSEVLARAKRTPSGAGQLASMPFLKRCESCGREAADTDRVPGAKDDPDRPRWVGPICERKRRMLDKIRRLAKATAAAREGSALPKLKVLLGKERIVVPAFSHRLLRQETPRDFRELTGGDDLAVVVADGNGLGEWFERTPSWDGFRTLSEQVHENLRCALEGALDAVVPKSRRRLPVQVLIAGGDDLVAALPAGYGLRFAQELVERFRVHHEGEVRGMAAGVLLARPTFPFRQAHALAGELLGRAKRRCRDDRCDAALDFHRVKGTHVQSLDEERSLLRREKPPGREWSYGASGPFTPDELRSLLELSERLREAVSATQRGVLREILSPRDDGPHTPLHDWGLPERVVRELETWLARQEEGRKPFDLEESTLISKVREGAGAGATEVARLRLADALLLADLHIEPGSE